MATKRPGPESPWLELPTTASFDVGALMKMQQASLDVFAEAGRIFTETAQGVARCQSEMIRDYVEQMGRAYTTFASPAEPDEKAKEGAAIAQALLEKTVGHAREIAELVGKSNADAIGLVNGRMRGLLKEGSKEAAGAPESRRHAHGAD